MKKTLTLILSLALAFSTLTVFAEEDAVVENGTEQILATEDIVQEDVNGEVLEEKDIDEDINSDSGEADIKDETDAEENIVTDEDVDAIQETDEEDISFEPTKEDLLSYDPLYIIENANSEYINVENIDMVSFYDIVAVSKGVATYNVSKQKDFDVTTDNYIAGLTYQMPIYDVDKDSNYYVMIPNVNKFDANFKAYDLIVAYDNDFGESISGWKYEKGILYIPKAVIDSPTNKYEIPEAIPIGVQLNYAIGGDMDFSKSIPVQILDNDEPKCKRVNTSNIFDLDALTVKTGVKNRKASDVSVYLNGSLIPMNDSAWDYDSNSGKIDIKVAPGVVSNVNVIFKQRNIIEKTKDTITSALKPYNAYATSLSGMSYFKTDDGKVVTLDISASDIFVGWRGFYNGKYDHGAWNQKTMDRLGSKTGFTDSFKYMYGGTTTGSGNPDSWSKNKKEKELAGAWAFSSYALDYDLGVKTNAGQIGVDEVITHWNKYTSTYEAKTIYDWMLTYRNDLELGKNRANQSLSNGNGIGGYTNFAFALPKRIYGADDAIVSSGANRGRANGTINFTSAELASAQGGSPTSTCYDYWVCASCNHLDEAADTVDEDASDAAIYVTCLDVANDYAVFAFVQSKKSYDQNACAIYKFKIQSNVDISVTKTATNSPVWTNNALYNISGTTFKLYSSQANAISNTGAVAVFTINAVGKSNTVSIPRGTYYLVETAAGPGIVVPDKLKPASGGVAVNIQNAGTINI